MSHLEQICAEVLEETHAFYREHHTALGHRGYEVMYGPALNRPDFFFIGFQPGGDHITTDHEAPAASRQPPEVSYYATENWRLAVNMRAMFGEAVLRRSSGTNAIFFRAPSMETYYADTPVELLPEIDRFCRRNILKIIAALDPKVIVAIGFSALAQFGPGYPPVTGPTGRSLVQIGSIDDRKAYATLHLSGARISEVDRRMIADFLLGRLEEAS